MEAYTKFEYDPLDGYKLHWAVLWDKPQELRKLLCQDKYRNSINFRSLLDMSLTPLHLASRQGFAECLQVLLDNGAEVDCLDTNAQTPLLFAVWSGSLKCVRALLQAGANPCGSRCNNIASVLIAVQHHQTAILQELVEHGAEVNIRPMLPRRIVTTVASNGPLYESVEFRNLECFRTLLLYGANPDYNCTDQEILKNTKKNIPLLEFCLNKGCDKSYIKLLIDFGANMYLPKVDTISYCNMEAKELLLTERVVPRSLMSLARLAFRKKLVNVGHITFIERLEVPTKIKQILKYEL